MRFYRIEITPAAGSPLAAAASTNSVPSGSNTTLTFTSLTSSGAFNPGALNIILDVTVAGFASPSNGQSYIELQGISLQMVAQANALSGATIQIFGGMSKGLPLANPSQQGLLVQGSIFQAFGNWVGPEMSLVLFIYPLAGLTPRSGPPNIVFSWRAKTPLADALKTTLTSAFPKTPVSVQLTDNLVLNHDETGFYTSLSGFAEFIEDLSKSIVKDDSYLGVQIIATGSQILVFDQASMNTPTQIAFTDLVGQPTWVNYGEIQLQCVMRGDLRVAGRIRLPLGNTVTLPDKTAAGTQTINALSLYGVINTPPSGPGPSRVQQAGVGPNGLIFQGIYVIRSLRHVGDFRTPDGAAWITIINAVPAPPIVTVQESSG